ncbi:MULTISPECIES: phosphatase domain-containing protein [Gammaproteobacteria]|uniref:phosphatase domain-containing protein n=1 Tax=Gammaproteobacteria TaxID=1236 RepID=UPI002FC967FA
MNQIYSQIKRYIRDNPGMPVYIFDYDGTLSDGTHRLSKLPTKDLHLTESWSEFNRLSYFDNPFEDTIKVMNDLSKTGYVIILTGRSDEVCELSLQWLDDHGAKFDVMVMRQASDNRKDTIIKEEFIRYIGLERITAAWDDSPNVINHFRELGITTYAVVDYGDKAHAGLGSHGVEKIEKPECDHLWRQSLQRMERTCVQCGKNEMIETHIPKCDHNWSEPLPPHGDKQCVNCNLTMDNLGRMEVL